MIIREVFFLRHGETEQNVRGIVQGSGIDSDLNDRGREQARQFHERYSSEGFDLIIHSSLDRTRQTIERFISADMPAETDERIREISWGEHEGKAGEPELMKKYHLIIGSWSSGDYHARPAGGESAHELQFRIQSFLDDLYARPFSKALVCTHGRTLRAMICLLRGWPLSRMEEVGHSNTGLYHGKVTGTEWNWLRENDLSHLTTDKP